MGTILIALNQATCNENRGSVGIILCVFNYVSKWESPTSYPSCFTAQESPSNHIRQEVKCIQEMMWMQQQTEKLSPPEIKPVTDCLSPSTVTILTAVGRQYKTHTNL